MIVGTHALIQQGVDFHRLGLAVVDEQHRFGVMQRSALRQPERSADGDIEGASSPHLLVMTATPIPRSLALTVYGDLDLTVIDELPPGRTPIKTRWLPPHDRAEAFAALRAEVEAGRQGFVICPLVEGSDAVVSRAATEEYERLCLEQFPDLADRIALLHGRMPGREKDAVMQRFARGEVSILVSTAVVEVGIDVPNATVMLIEGADRFGLSQLHQFRGRVGRGEHASACFLLADDPSAEAQERLSLVARNRDGFALAQADLELRGPGELFGTRQAGAPSPARRFAARRPPDRRHPPGGGGAARGRPGARSPAARRPAHARAARRGGAGGGGALRRGAYTHAPTAAEPREAP